MTSKPFDKIAYLVRTYRNQKGWSQSELSHKLGYKNGQFISNVERGLCGLPHKKAAELAILLDVPEKEVSNALLSDFTLHLEQTVIGRINELRR